MGHTYTNIILEIKESVGIITLNRPTVLNALSQSLMKELAHAVSHLEATPTICVIVLKGSEQSFAVGADIRELLGRTYASNYAEDFITQHWERISQCRIPTIAAVAGLAMGAGCELAMMCDMIIAAQNARFAQPEVSIGLIPGAGGTQRLPRLVGKAKAMDMCLTGRFMDAEEAERQGLISRVVPLKAWMDEVMTAAERIAQMSRPVLMMAKEAINRGYDMPLQEGIKQERRLFQALFSLDDPKEGMQAFLEKRSALFRNH